MNLCGKMKKLDYYSIKSEKSSILWWRAILMKYETRFENTPMSTGKFI